MNKEKMKDLAIAVASAMAGRYVTTGAMALKNWKAVLGAITSVILIVVVLASIIVSLPGIIMQAMLPQEKEEQKTLSLFAQNEISETESEKKVSIAELLESLKEVDEEGNVKEAVLTGDEPTKEEVLMIYVVKYGEYFDENNLDKKKIREITRSFLKVRGLFVDVKPFDEVVREHNLSEEQMAIALNMYDGYMYDQNVSIGDADNYINFGNITYKNGNTDVVYFSQRDEKWAMERYGDSTIGRTGCGPTSLSIVVSSLTGNKVTPKEMCDWAYKQGFKHKGGGSYWSLIPSGAKHFGLSVSGDVEKGQEIVDALADGKLLIVIMGKGHFTSTGHFIVLRGVTDDGKIMVADPYSKKNTDTLWSLSTIINESKKGKDSGGPFWIISQ